ncbi:MAG: GerMN domain-containing protein [Ruminiclostridium sp.]|nr:GerMN domain-containing protein [Ruminiclostridium sp.]
MQYVLLYGSTAPGDARGGRVMRKVVLIVTLCMFILLTFSGCGILQKLGLQKTDDELHPVSSIVMGEDEAKKLTDKVPVHLYFANGDNTRLMKEIRYIQMSDARQSTSHLASVIVKELISGSSKDKGFKATIPVGTKLRAPVAIKGGVATVDFSKEFKSMHPGGKDAEKMTIFSVVNSLTELKDILKVRFTIDGKILKEYLGNYQFDVPFSRSAGLISKETIVPGSNETSGAEQNDTAKKATPIPTDSKTKPGDSKTTGGEEEGGSSDVTGDDIEFLE